MAGGLSMWRNCCIIELELSPHARRRWNRDQPSADKPCQIPQL